MSFQLVIAEKPSVARSIAAVIGATEKQTGYWQGGGYLVSWCIGHLVSFAEAGQYDAVILAVAHRQLSERGADGIRGFGKPGAVVFDVKRTLPRHAVDDCL